jgi:hypothetical protein
MHVSPAALRQPLSQVPDVASQGHASWQFIQSAQTPPLKLPLA